MKARHCFVYTAIILILLIAAPATPPLYSLGESSQEGGTRSAQVCSDENHCVLAEIAATPAAHSKGLTFRKSLPEDRGMLFIFPRSDYWQIWMKDTLIPLDIVWLDKNKRIVSIAKEALPCKTEPCYDFTTPKKALYVLEFNAGTAAKWYLKTGDQLNFEVPKKIPGNLQ